MLVCEYDFDLHVAYRLCIYCVYEISWFFLFCSHITLKFVWFLPCNEGVEKYDKLIASGLNEGINKL